MQWDFWVDSLVATVATDGGLEGYRAGETLRAKPHWGLQGWSLPQHCCTSAKGPQAPAPTMLLHGIVWPRLLAQPVGDPPTPIPVKNARHPPGLHLLVGGAAPSDQHHVEAREADDGDEEEAGHTHDGHAGPLRPMAKGEDGAAACG